MTVGPILLIYSRGSIKGREDLEKNRLVKVCTLGIVLSYHKTLKFKQQWIN